MAWTGLTASPAFAQTREPAARPISIGEPTTSEIDTGDREFSGQYTEDYTLQLTLGQRVRIEMDATEPRLFDTYLRLFDPAGNQLTYNDDRRDGTLNSRIIFQAPETATYNILAQGFASRTGTYRLSVSLLPPSPAPLAIAPGQHPIILDSTAGVDDESGGAVHYREFMFDGTEGDRVYLRATPDVRAATANQSSSDEQSQAEADLADAVVVDLKVTQGGREVASVRGLPGFDDPRLVVILPRTGRYVLRASALLDSNLRLTLGFDQRSAGGQGPPVIRTLPRIATSVRGALSLDSGVYNAPDNPAAIASLADIHAIQVQQNEVVVVTVESTDFDPILDAGTLSILGYATAWTNNDGDEGFNSRLELRPARSGIVHLRVRSVLPAVGEYQLRIERRPTPPRPAPGAG